MWQQSWQCLKTLPISKKKQEMLWKVAEKSGEKLSESERNQLYVRICSSPHVPMSSHVVMLSWDIQEG